MQFAEVHMASVRGLVPGVERRFVILQPLPCQILRSYYVPLARDSASELEIFHRRIVRRANAVGDYNGSTTYRRGS